MGGRQGRVYHARFSGIPRGGAAVSGVHCRIMATDNKGVSKEEAIRRGLGALDVQLEEPAATPQAQQQAATQPAQVTPKAKKSAERHPEEMAAPGEMGPPEGPGA